MFELLVSDGMLVIRLLLVMEDEVIQGFKEDVWREAL